jgi:hypothetical protein
VTNHAASIHHAIFVTSGYFDFSILQLAISFFKS